MNESVMGKQYTKEDIERAVELSKKTWSLFIDAARDVIKSIREKIQFIVDHIAERKSKKAHDYNWHVPKNICRNHQVLSRKPIVAHIRNHL